MLLKKRIARYHLNLFDKIISGVVLGKGGGDSGLGRGGGVVIPGHPPSV